MSRHLCRDIIKGQTTGKMSQHMQCSAAQGIYVAKFETRVTTLTKKKAAKLYRDIKNLCRDKRTQEDASCYIETKARHWLKT